VSEGKLFYLHGRPEPRGGEVNFLASNQGEGKERTRACTNIRGIDRYGRGGGGCASYSLWSGEGREGGVVHLLGCVKEGGLVPSQGDCCPRSS